MKDRFYGNDDPVANKYLERAKSAPKLEAPTDKTIATLWVGGIALQDGSIGQEDLRDQFYRCVHAAFHAALAWAIGQWANCQAWVVRNCQAFGFHFISFGFMGTAPLTHQ